MGYGFASFFLFFGALLLWLLFQYKTLKRGWPFVVLSLLIGITIVFGTLSDNNIGLGILIGICFAWSVFSIAWSARVS